MCLHRLTCYSVAEIKKRATPVAEIGLTNVLRRLAEVPGKRIPANGFRALLARLGYGLAPIAQTPNLAQALRKLIREGLEINVVYDIGAHKGAWTSSMARVLSPNCSFYLFEANEAHYDELHKTGHPFFQVLLAEKPATRRFYSIGGTGDSLYRESTEHYLKVRPQTVEATTLDLFRESMGLRAPDLIKFDTQGSELEIMRGGLQCVSYAKLLYLEIPILAYNKGAPNFTECIDFLGDLNFIPIGIHEIHILHHALVQVDVLFASEQTFTAIFGDEELTHYFTIKNG